MTGWERALRALLPPDGVAATPDGAAATADAALASQLLAEAIRWVAGPGRVGEQRRIAAAAQILLEEVPR